MSKLVFLTDTHFGRKNFSKTFFKEMMDYYEQVFFPYLLDHKIKSVLHLGDLMDNRNITDNWLDGQLKKRFFGWFKENDVKLYCLVGNHDSYFKNTISHNWQQANLKEFDNVEVIDIICTSKIENYTIGFVPWLTSIEQVRLMPKPDKVDFLCGHFEISGALMQGNTYSKKGFPIDVLDNYKAVYSGHFHATSQHQNLRYLGTPYQMDYRDYGNEKGFWVMDDFKMSYIRNDFSPKFLKIYYMEGDDDPKPVLKLGGIDRQLIDVTLDEAVKWALKNNVKLVVKRYKNQDILERYFEVISREALGRMEIINESSLIEDLDIEKFQEGVRDDVEITTIMESFVELSEFSLDVNKDEVVSLLNDLYTEAMEQRIIY